MDSESHSFPAVKGIQAQKEYYTAMVSLGNVSQLFKFVDESLSAENRCQRKINQSRIPQICNYIVRNREDYIFSSITVSINGEIEFKPVSDEYKDVGILIISNNARIIINDGQHRIAAIKEAIKCIPELENEKISVVFYPDKGLKRSQQMFSDLNRYSCHPTKSINVLYDSRDLKSRIAKSVVQKVDVFNGLTDTEKSKLSKRAKALFTLSAISSATEELLSDYIGTESEKENLAVEYWTKVSEHIPQWTDVRDGKCKASDIRDHYLCSMSVAMYAIGHGGRSLLKTHPNDWIGLISNLDNVDWSKNNPEWNGIILVEGKISTNRAAQKRISNYIEAIMTGKIGVDNG